MNILKAAKNVVSKAAEQTVAKTKAAMPSSPVGTKPSARDTFAAALKPKVVLHALGEVVKLTTPTFKPMPAGVQVNQGPIRVDLQASKQGGSLEIGGERYGAHFRTQDGEALLGAVSFEAAGKEVSVGMVPAAPSPLPMPVYKGPTRED